MKKLSSKQESQELGKMTWSDVWNRAFMLTIDYSALHAGLEEEESMSLDGRQAGR